MTKDELKEKAIDAIPYVAVFGIAALAVYGITKMVQSINDMDFPLDWGHDHYLDTIGK